MTPLLFLLLTCMVRAYLPSVGFIDGLWAPLVTFYLSELIDLSAKKWKGRDNVSVGEHAWSAAEVCALGRLASAPEGSTAGGYCRSKTPVSRQSVPPNQGPPPRHLLPKTLKPSPGFKLHPALPASALVNSSHEIRSMALQPATANQRPSGRKNRILKLLLTIGCLSSVRSLN